MLKCPNCYSEDLVREGDYYICQICGKRILVEELELSERQSKARLSKFKTEIHDVFYMLGQGITRRELDEALEKNSRDIEERLSNDRQGYAQFIQEQKDNYADFLAELELAKSTSSEKDVGSSSDYIQFNAELFLKNYDFQGFASRLYSNIEHNLIYEYHLEYKRNEFIISTEQYNALIKKTMEDKSSYSPLIYWKETEKKYVPLIPKKEFLPGYYKMIPSVRFLCAGLDNYSAKKGQTMWNVLNWIRHDNDENVKHLKKVLDKAGVDMDDKNAMKNYLQTIVDFFRDKGLYTKD